MDYVNVNDPRVISAIEFVEEVISFRLKNESYDYLKEEVEKLPWIYYSPAITQDDIDERDSLINKYGSSRPDQIEYYLFYHGCHNFAVFYWTVLRANGISTKIVCQERPFRHTYLLADDEVVDALLSYCGVNYPHQPEECQIFDTPHDFYAEVFISKTDQQDWEIETLDQLKKLE